MTTVDILVNAKKDRQVGNHDVFHCNTWHISNDSDGKTIILDNCTRVFRYHYNTICVVDDNKKVFWISHAGWFTRSTNKALAAYRSYFQYVLGYKNVLNIPVYKYERVTKKGAAI
jgi:hypothetical protein